MRPEWVPDSVDIDRPSIARVYDYLLGGSHNFKADRDAADRVIGGYPGSRLAAYANRDFLRRAVLFCVEQGVTQFLDVGSGIPTAGNVHAVAQAADPDARVGYVDIDPVAVAHSRSILAGNPRAGVVQADVREPERILADPEVAGLLDFDRPVALLLLAVLHFLPDAEDPQGIVARYLDRLAPGSLLVISHSTEDDVEGGGENDEFADAVAANVVRLSTRSKPAVTRFFNGLELVEPGVEWVSRWRPDEGADTSATHHLWGGVGRKPRTGRGGGDRW